MEDLCVKSVNPANPAIKALLEYLMLATLGNTFVYDVSEGYWWVAEKGGLPVGFCGLVQSSRWHDAGYLCRSGVLPAHRGRGLQKRMLRVRESKARKLGWNWLITDTFQNPASSNSLIGCDYRIFSPTKPWGFDGAVYWRKRLKKVTATTR